MDVLRELPELDGGDGQRARNLQAAVDGRKMVRVVGILDESPRKPSSTARRSRSSGKLDVASAAAPSGFWLMR